MWRKGGGFGQKEENWKICSMTTKSVRYIFSNLLVSNLNALLVGTSWGESHNRSEGSEAGAAAIQFSRITAEGVTDPLFGDALVKLRQDHGQTGRSAETPPVYLIFRRRTALACLGFKENI